MKTIFSCDPGIDDAFALLIMSKFTDGPSVILASYGNAPAETTLRNARILAKHFGLNSKIISSSKQRIDGMPTQFDWFHGPDGLGNLSTKIMEQTGIADFESSFNINEIEDFDMFSTGPLTDAATIISKYPEIAKHIKHLYVMGGGIKRFNSPHDTEYNFYCDPEAVNIVFNSNVDLTIFPLDITLNYPITKEDIDKLGTLNKDKLMVDLLDKCRVTFEDSENEGAILHDAFPVLYSIDSSNFEVEFKQLKCDVFGHIYEDKNGRIVKVAKAMKPKALYNALVKAISSQPF